MTTPVNSGFIRQMEGWFIHRNDYYNRWGNVISSLMLLPNSAGIWPGLSIRGADGLAGAGNLRSDVGGNHLGDNGTRPQFDYLGLIPIVKYDGSADYHSIADASVNSAFNFVGNESWIPSTNRGLCIGGWFYNDGGLPGGLPRLIGKGTTTGSLRHYAMYGGSATQVSMSISTTGADFNTPTTYGAGSNDVDFPQDEWSLLVGRFNSSTSLSIDSWTTSGRNQQIGTTAVPATIANLSSGFAIAAQADGTRLVPIWGSMMFAVGQYLPDSFFTALYEQTRIFFPGHI